MSQRVLFVDDEPPVLDALRNLLRKYRKVWEMSFATSGTEALEALAATPFDVVVSDMRMPGMDGASLLAEVKERHPACARVILSGHADRDLIVRALPVAHQYLSKPCDAEVLRLAIERTCALQTQLHNETVRALVGRLERLPSAPQVYWDLTALLARDNVTQADVAAIVEGDPAMVAKLLQLVNSAYFGLARRISSVEQAVAYLGLDLVRTLAVSAHLFDATQVHVPGFSLDNLQRASLWTARLAKKVARPDDSADAYTAGLLRDLGQVILSAAAPKEFGQALAAAAANPQPQHQAEQHVLGVTHAAVGGYLLGVWGLPIEIVEAVAHHHTPALAPPESQGLVRAVHIADALVEHAILEAAGAKVDEQLDMAFVEATGGTSQLPRWRDMAREMVEDEKAAEMGAAR